MRRFSKISLVWAATIACGNAEVIVRPGEGGGGQIPGTGGTDAQGGDGAGFQQAGGAGGMGEGGLGGEAPGPACGDGKIDPGEACDDGNGVSGDGCTGTCDAVENNFACPFPGQPCVSTVVCGDGNITGAETCDDGNVIPGDGCSDDCALEVGWLCPDLGEACLAAACGDSVVAGSEDCDDGNPDGGDGCSAHCQLEPATTATRSTGMAARTPARTRSSSEPCHLIGSAPSKSGCPASSVTSSVSFLPASLAKIVL